MRGLTLAPERETLIDWHERIAVYLREHLRLELNAKRTRLRPVSAGVDFVGYIARRDYLLLRRRVVSNIKFKLKEYHAELVREGRCATGGVIALTKRDWINCSRRSVPILATR